MANKKSKKQQNNKKPEHLKEIDRKTQVDVKATIEAEDKSELIKQLMKAAKSGDVAEVEHLIEEKKVDVNSFDGIGKTALHYASESGDADLVRTLLALKANIDSKDNLNITPLMVAVCFERLDIVETLLEKEASLNIESDLGKTPLDCAALENNLNIINLLLDKGAKVREGTMDKSILHYAAYGIKKHDNWDTIKLLFKEYLEKEQYHFDKDFAVSLFNIFYEHDNYGLTNNDCPYIDAYKALIEKMDVEISF